jgi:ribosomal protein L29
MRKNRVAASKDNPHGRLREAKKDVARVKTFLTVKLQSKMNNHSHK